MSDALFVIQPRIRRAVLNNLHDGGVSRSVVLWEMGKRRGFGNLGELLDFVGDSYRQDVAEDLVVRLEATLSEQPGRLFLHRSMALDAIAHEVLSVIPDEMFIFAVEIGENDAVGRATEAGRIIDFRAQFQATVSELFLANGVPYHFEDDRIVPSLSPTVSAASVQPVVDVLHDDRMAVPRTHFLDALRRLQEPDADEAVDEARQAVEACLLALLDAHAVPRPEKRQANELFTALVPDVLPRTAEELVLATPRFRGRTSAGHAGGPPVTPSEAQAAVAAAAASLLYLAHKLPPSQH